MAPFLLVAILFIASDKKLMQGQPSSRLGWTVVAITTMAMFAAGIRREAEILCLGISRGNIYWQTTVVAELPSNPVSISERLSLNNVALRIDKAYSEPLMLAVEGREC